MSIPVRICSSTIILLSGRWINSDGTGDSGGGLPSAGAVVSAGAADDGAVVDAGSGGVGWVAGSVGAD
jgi:hypothetical protein